MSAIPAAHAPDPHTTAAAATCSGLGRTARLALGDREPHTRGDGAIQPDIEVLGGRGLARAKHMGGEMPGAATNPEGHCIGSVLDPK